MTDTTIVDTGICLVCGKRGQVTVSTEALKIWEAGELFIQEIPGFTVDQREQLLSGIHGACYDQMFPAEE